MAWNEAERAQLRTEYFLRYVAVKLPADSAALLRPRHEASLLVLARTELWPAPAFDHAERLWHYKRARLIEGGIERHASVALLPLFANGTPQLQALLALCGLEDGYVPNEEHRDLFARLLDEVAAGSTRRDPSAILVPARVVGSAPGRDALEDAQRTCIEDALAHTRGNVTAAARVLRVPLRTLKDRIRRFDVDAGVFRVRPT
jgi:hypothetical protein